MPQTYSPPATGVDSASRDPREAGEIVGGRHVLEPEQPDPGILDPPADIDRLLRPPALVDVAHQLDVGADRLADLDHALDLDRRRRLAGQRELRLHLAPALFLQGRGGLDDPVERQAAHQRARGIGRHPLARAAEQLPQRQVQRFGADDPTARCRAPTAPDDRCRRVRPSRRRRSSASACTASTSTGSSPTQQRAEFVDRMRARCGSARRRNRRRRSPRRPHRSRPAAVTIGRLPFGFSAAPASGSSAGNSTICVVVPVIFIASPSGSDCRGGSSRKTWQPSRYGKRGSACPNSRALRTRQKHCLE